MNRLVLAGSASLLLLAAQLGCKGTAKPPKFDPEQNSGPDAKRAGAMLIEVNKQYTDTVDFDKGDRTDWKMVELKGTPGPLEVELHWDNALTDLTVDVFDGIGVQLQSSPPNSGESVKHLTVPIQELPGNYYIRIQAPKAGATSDYTVKADWNGEASAPPPPPDPVPDKDPKPKPPKPKPGPKPVRVSKGTPEGSLQGRIVGAHGEGGGTVLYLDKGAAAGVKEGQNGWILEGGSGFSVVDGGTFSITKVVDDGRSVGKTSLKSIGRNTRIAINTGK